MPCHYARNTQLNKSLMIHFHYTKPNVDPNSTDFGCHTTPRSPRIQVGLRWCFSISYDKFHPHCLWLTFILRLFKLIQSNTTCHFFLIVHAQPQRAILFILMRSSPFGNIHVWNNIRIKFKLKMTTVKLLFDGVCMRHANYKLKQCRQVSNNNNSRRRSVNELD